MQDYPLLDKINLPCDLRKLSRDQLPQLCDELRVCLLETVSQTGGHLASGLGVVELTVALHYTFDTPNDSLVWDVGHQAYPHKMLTGRRSRMHTLKQIQGLSGFPKRDESTYDDFGVGHSSTSISAALGMAIADELIGKNHSHVAVIGDGAMTAGMAFEALQHAGALSSDLLVVLNDNNMSISPNVGGLSSYLSKIIVSDGYRRFQKTSKRVFKAFPPINYLTKNAETKIKNLVGLSNIFTGFGFDYQGPVDGHDVLSLIDILHELKENKGPKLLHIKTTKGKGYKKAEVAPITYHGVSNFDVKNGVKTAQMPSPITFTGVFSQWIYEAAVRDKRLVAITPAMREGSGLVEFSQQFPSRYFDVAIAEQHAVTLAAGMACKGAKPVVTIYSTFLQRAYDQLIHDVALQNLDVLFAVDRAGVVGEDGSTHAGVFDLSFSRIIPNMIIMAPSDENEMIKMLNTGFLYTGPALVRYPKGSGPLGYTKKNITETIEIGKANVINQGKDFAILSFGTLLSRLDDIARDINATLVDMRFIKPVDKNLIQKICDTHSKIFVLEEGCSLGGIGEHIQSLVMEISSKTQVKCIGISDEFVAHGKRDEILRHNQLDEDSLRRIIDKFRHDKA